MTPVRILFLAADPYSYDPNVHRGQWDPRLGLDEDLRAIQQKVRAAEHRDALQFVPRLAARPDDLLQAMNEVRPHVVHFSGHASSDGVVLVGTDGGPHPVSGEALARLFRAAGNGVRLVVLSACETEQVAAALAPVVGCAIGMHGEMPDESALTFNASFYRAVAFGRSVQEAFDQGVTAVQLEGLDGAERPRLLHRDDVCPAAIVLVEDHPQLPGQERREAGQVVNVTGDRNQVYVAGRDLRM